MDLVMPRERSSTRLFCAVFCSVVVVAVSVGGLRIGEAVGSGGVWWEGHIVVSTGAGLYFGGGKFMFNGAWTLSQEACVPARTGNTIVGLQAVSPRFLQDVRACEENSCRRAELFIKYCTKGRSGAGSHAFGPEFSFRLR